MMNNAFDIGAIIASLLLFFVYHVVLYSAQCLPHRVRDQLSVPMHANLENSDLWVMKHRDKSDAQSVTLAIQSLRNCIMVGVFIGE
jgi:hypothetical protein